MGLALTDLLLVLLSNHVGSPELGIGTGDLKINKYLGKINVAILDLYRE